MRREDWRREDFFSGASRASSSTRCSAPLSALLKPEGWRSIILAWRSIPALDSTLFFSFLFFVLFFFPYCFSFSFCCCCRFAFVFFFFHVLLFSPPFDFSAFFGFPCENEGRILHKIFFVPPFLAFLANGASSAGNGTWKEPSLDAFVPPVSPFLVAISVASETCKKGKHQLDGSESRIRVPFFLKSILVGEPSPKKSWYKGT